MVFLVVIPSGNGGDFFIEGIVEPTSDFSDFQCAIYTYDKIAERDREGASGSI